MWLLVWRCVADADVAGEGDEAVGRVVCAEGEDGLVCGVALGDAAEVEAYVGLGECRGARDGVEEDGRAEGEGAIELFGRGEAIGLARLAPERDGGGEGDVEGVVGGGADLFGDGEDVEEVRADLVRRVVLGGGEGVELAGLEIIAASGVELGEAVERGGGGLGGVFGSGGVEDDAGVDAHDDAAELVAGEG